MKIQVKSFKVYVIRGPEKKIWSTKKFKKKQLFLQIIYNLF